MSVFSWAVSLARADSSPEGLEELTRYNRVREKLLDDLMRKAIVADLKAGRECGKLKALYAIACPPKIYACFVTVSFRSGITPIDVCAALVKYKAKNYISSCEVYHEQRGEVIAEMGVGYHVHIILQTTRSVAKVHILRDAYSTFKAFVDGENFIDYRKITTMDGLRSYVDGNKSDDKMPRVLIDRLFRQKYGVGETLVVEAPPTPIGGPQ